VQALWPLRVRRLTEARCGSAVLVARFGKSEAANLKLANAKAFCFLIGRTLKAIQHETLSMYDEY